MIVDVHTHIFTDKVYRDYLAQADGRVEKLITIHFSVDPNDNMRRQRSLKEVIDFASSHNNLFVIAAVNIHHSIETQLKEIEEYLSHKVVGLKMYPGYQHFYPSDDITTKVAEFCQHHNKPLIFHSGDVNDRLGKAELKYAHPIHIDTVAVKYPECKIVIAHCGFPYLLETATIVSKNKNVYTDVSGTIDSLASVQDTTALREQYQKDLQRAFAYFPDIKKKVMFGTDYGGEHTRLNEVESYMQLVEDSFSPQEQDNVFYKTAEAVFFETNS